jgi:hypothetical protein
MALGCPTGVVSSGIGVDDCAKALDAARKGIATPTARAVRTNPNFVIIVLIIGFSIGVWLGFGVTIKDELCP